MKPVEKKDSTARKNLFGSSKEQNMENWVKFKARKLGAECKPYKGREHDGTNWKILVNKAGAAMGPVCRKTTCAQKKTCHTLEEANAKCIFEGFWGSGEKQNTYSVSKILNVFIVYQMHKGRFMGGR